MTLLIVAIYLHLYLTYIGLVWCDLYDVYDSIRFVIISDEVSRSRWNIERGVGRLQRTGNGLFTNLQEATSHTCRRQLHNNHNSSLTLPRQCPCSTKCNLYCKYLWYIHKISTIWFIILCAIKRTELHISYTIIDRVDLYVYIIYFSFDAHCHLKK